MLPPEGLTGKAALLVGESLMNEKQKETDRQKWNRVRRGMA